MNELIKVIEKNGQKLVSARDLHDFLEVKNHFTQWFNDNKNQFIENVDYEAIKVNLIPANGVGLIHKTDYALTLKCAKHLSMLSKVEKGKVAREYFIKCEESLHEIKKFEIPQTFAQALMLAAKQAEQLELQEKELVLKENKLIEQKPKVEFFDAVTDSKDAIDMATCAKVLNLGIGRNLLFEYLRNKKVLMDNNQPYQKYVDMGLFRVIEQKYTKPSGETNINIKTVVYQKGLDYIRKIYREDNP